MLGYYSLAAGSVSHDEGTERVKKGLTRHPIPVILLARLAVDVSIHGKGVGSALLKDALLRTAQAAETIGARALLVHAKDDEARAFYEHFTFEASPSDPYHLLLIMKDEVGARARFQELVHYGTTARAASSLRLGHDSAVIDAHLIFPDPS